MKKQLDLKDLDYYYDQGFLNKRIMKGWIECASYIIDKFECNELDLTFKKLHSANKKSPFGAN